MYDKSKEFEEIEKKLDEIRIQCNRLQIPFFWIAAVKDSKKDTKYRAALDENSNIIEDSRNYRCNALVPGCMGITLQHDLIRDIIKVLAGFKVVANDTPIATIDSREYTMEALFPKVQGSYAQTDEGNMVIDDSSYINNGNTDLSEIVVPELDFEKSPDTQKPALNESVLIGSVIEIDDAINEGIEVPEQELCLNMQMNSKRQ